MKISLVIYGLTSTACGNFGRYWSKSSSNLDKVCKQRFKEQPRNLGFLDHCPLLWIESILHRIRIQLESDPIKKNFENSFPFQCWYKDCYSKMIFYKEQNIAIWHFFNIEKFSLRFHSDFLIILVNVLISRDPDSDPDTGDQKVLVWHCIYLTPYPLDLLYKARVWF